MRNNLIKIILIIIIVVWGHILYSQSNAYIFSHLNSENGLSNNSITCIYKDSKSFIWIGTTNGLNRYDGNAFQVFRHEPADSNSISDNFISNIIEDSTGNIWVGTQGGGLNVFNPRTEKFNRYSVNKQHKQGIMSNFIYHHQSMAINKNGLLYAGTDCGFFSIDTKRKEIQSYYLRQEGIESNKLDNVRVIKENNGVLWIGTNAGLIKYSKAKGLEKMYNDKTNPVLSNNIITALETDKDGIWIGTEEGLNYLDFQTEKIFLYINKGEGTISDNSITAIVADNEKNIWIGTKSGGLNRLNTKNNKIDCWKYDPFNNKGISDNYIDYLFFDNNDLLWIGTVNKGLNILDLNEKKFKLYRNNISNINSLSYNTIRSLYEDSKSNIWIGTYGGGLNKYDGKNFMHFTHDPRQSLSLSHNIVSAIFELETNIMLV